LVLSRELIGPLKVWVFTLFELKTAERPRNHKKFIWADQNCVTDLCVAKLKINPKLKAIVVSLACDWNKVRADSIGAREIVDSFD